MLKFSLQILVFLFLISFSNKKEASYIIFNKSNCLPCVNRLINYLKINEQLESSKIIVVYETKADLSKNIEQIRQFEALKSKKIYPKKDSVTIDGIKIKQSNYGPNLIFKSKGKMIFFNTAMIDSLM